MKISFHLGLLVATLIPASVWAQPLPVPATFITDAKTVLAPDFVRDADLIIVTRLVPIQGEIGVAHAVIDDSEVIRGKNYIVAAGLVMPTKEVLAEVIRIETVKSSLALGQFDPVRQRMILTARLDATPELIERVRELERENQKITVTFSTDKTSYSPDDEIILKWEARNTSPTPQKIYVGTYALQHTASYGGAGYSNASGSHTRTAVDYITLAPGEVWSDTRTLRVPFPTGQVSIAMRLDSSDNFVGAQSKSLLETDRAEQERVEGVALFEAHGKVVVNIAAPLPDDAGR